MGVSRETAPHATVTGVSVMEPRELTADLTWAAEVETHLGPLHDLLATEGVTRGLIGPREVPRLWHRHLRNCVVVVDPSLELVGSDATVCDIGSGAGLPGLVWAIARPDLRITLLEPLQRRSRFLHEAVTELGLADRVAITTGRAQDVAPLGVDVVTSRALAPLPTVVEWSWPHLAANGSLIAIKGGKASEELADSREMIAEHGGRDAEVIRIGPEGDDGHPQATVVRVLAGG